MPFQKKLVAAACAAVILWCGASLWPSSPRGPRPEGEHQGRVCDVCGKRFQGSPSPGLSTCPECGKAEGVRVYTYACRACGERFEGFRERPADPANAPTDGRPQPLLVKRPGGQWVKSLEEAGPIVCPKCKSPDVSCPVTY